MKILRGTATKNSKNGIDFSDQNVFYPVPHCQYAQVASKLGMKSRNTYARYEQG